MQQGQPGQPGQQGQQVKIGKYEFRIQDNESRSPDGKLYSRNFKIGGKYSDCVNVSIKYDKDERPISAKIPTLVYDEECSLTAPLIPLDRGEGTVTMIKTLLRYIHKQLPSITEFVFEDKSTIECGTEEEKYRKRHRKRGTYATPLVLYYFSIAFNGITWYEKHFKAYQQDEKMHESYKERVKELLTNESMKPDFNEFLRIAQPPTKYLEDLKTFYEKSSTYGEFFKSMPRDDRCQLVREWLPSFMEYYLQGVFKNTDWVIDVNKMDTSVQTTGITGGTKKKGRRQKQRRNRQYYCPEGRIRLSIESQQSFDDVYDTSSS